MEKKSKQFNIESGIQDKTPIWEFFDTEVTKHLTFVTMQLRK